MKTGTFCIAPTPRRRSSHRLFSMNLIVFSRVTIIFRFPVNRFPSRALYWITAANPLNYFKYKGEVSC